MKSVVRTVVFVAAALPLWGCTTVGHLSTHDDGERIAGKTFVVVGASSGFGRGVAIKLAADGANVVVAARRVALLEQVAAEVSAAGGTPLVVPTDVTRQDDVRRLADAAMERFGRIDVWMNVAGTGALGRFEDIPVEDHSRLIDTNVKGVIYGSHAAMRQFRRQGFGTLVNIGSVESEIPLAYRASYAASKAAVLSLGRTLNEEIRLSGMKGITVATVMPWAADTPWWEHAANYTGHAPRMALPDDPQKVVDAIVWVAVHPREELPVGWKARTTYVFHHLFPDVTERVSADLSRREIEMGAPAPPTSGALYAPTPEGRTVEGGLRERMKEEDAARRR